MFDNQDCVFCNLPAERIIQEESECFVIRDAFPVTHLHTLIIPKRHVADYFNLSASERERIEGLLQEQRKVILDLDPTISGFNIGVNVGRDAGQTVFHVHIHLIPRRHGDVSEPRGGVRGVIPEKQQY